MFTEIKQTQAQQAVSKRINEKKGLLGPCRDYYDHMDTDDYSVHVGDDSNP